MDDQQPSPAEDQLAAWGVSIEETEFPQDVDPGLGGYAEVHHIGDVFDVTLLMRPKPDAWERAMFAEWAVSRIRRFAEHGAEPDGWQRRSDDGWQLWTRLVYLGDVG